MNSSWDHKKMTLAFTGHRPPKLGGYESAAINRVKTFAYDYLKKASPKKVISGMALGWDTAVARAAIKLKIPLIAAVPFAGQESKWRLRDQEMYRYLLQYASIVHVVSPDGYSPEKMQIRNQWMVDNCDVLVALWNGSDGGTANCIEYAQGKKPVVNLWEAWDAKIRACSDA